MSEAEDYWDFDGAATGIVTPRDILEQQAALLKEHTGGVLRGEVRTEPSDGDLFHELVIRASALRYEYSLLSVTHPAELFPLSFYADNIRSTIQNMAEFKKKVKEMLGSEKTKRIVESLIAQSRSSNT